METLPFLHWTMGSWGWGGGDSWFLSSLHPPNVPGMKNDTVSESRGGCGTNVSYCKCLLPQCSLANPVLHAFILFKPNALYMPGTVLEHGGTMER